MNEFDKMVIREFVADNWSSFKSFAEGMGVDVDEVYVALGGEADE